jgi:hypothetical protein
VSALVISLASLIFAPSWQEGLDENRKRSIHIGIPEKRELQRFAVGKNFTRSLASRVNNSHGNFSIPKDFCYHKNLPKQMHCR